MCMYMYVEYLKCLTLGVVCPKKSQRARESRRAREGDLNDDQEDINP